MLRRLLYGIGVLLVMGFIALVIVTIVYRQYLDTPIDPARGEPAVVKVPKGNLRDVLAVLVQNDLVTQPTLFELHASFTGKATQVKAGTFLLDYRWTPSELLHHLVEGTSPAIRKLRLPPGLNQWKVADRVERAGLGKSGAFITLLQSAHLPDMLGLSVPSPDIARFKKLDLSYRAPLEGYLFPGNYEFPWEAVEADVIERGTQAFRRVWGELKTKHKKRMAELMKEFGLREHDFVILASLVEKEAVMHDEKPTIAGVFYNRLRDGWRLQTDPTLIYHPETYRDRPSPKHRRDKSKAYNTYAIKGLPPGPIANPGKSSLEAVLNPKASPYFFFVARADGSNRHTFSVTLDEHRKKIRKHLK